MSEASGRLIVALDVDSVEEAERIVRELDDLVSFYKVGWQLFLPTHFQFVKRLSQLGKRIFLDLKMEDIPEIIQLAIRSAPDVEFIELMTLKGTSQLIRAAKQGARKGNGETTTKFLMLTVLSSQDDEDVHEIYGTSATLDDVVRMRARKAIDAGCDGLIASGQSIQKLREEFGRNFLIVAPGIRPKGSSTDDHKRTRTPYEAIRDGADYIVVGRPITKNKNMRAAAERVVTDIEAACKETGSPSESRDPRAMFAAS